MNSILFHLVENGISCKDVMGVFTEETDWNGDEGYNKDTGGNDE